MLHRQALNWTAVTLLLIAGTGCGKSGSASAGVTSSGGTDGAKTGGAAGTADGSGGAGGTVVPAASGGTAGGPAVAGVSPPLVDAFVATARQIAADYTAWGRVDDELRWAPALCRIPLPGIARQSESKDATTHGQKLYSVFAKNHGAYPDGPQSDQVVVKQSWTAELVADGASSSVSHLAASATFPPDAGDHFYPYADGDGGVYRATEFAGLYIMFRLDPATPDTDEGWVYATITPDGQVTAAGRVASCMGCHEVATHERLFGVPLSPSFSN